MATTSIEERATLFSSLLRRMREPLLLAARDGRILRSNVAAAEALGTSVALLERATVADYSPEPALVANQLAAIDATLSFGLRARDGRRFSCSGEALDADILLLRLSGGPEPEARLRALSEALFPLQEVAAGSDSARAADATFEALLAAAMVETGAVVAAVWLVDASVTRIELRASIDASDETMARFRAAPISAPTPLTDAIRERVPVLIATGEEARARYPELSKTHHQFAENPTACLPLLSGERPLGVLGFRFPPQRYFTDEQRRLLLEMALRFVPAIERERAEADPISETRAERSASRLARLHAFTGPLARAITWEQVVESVVDMGMAAAGARIGGLWILSDDGATVTLVRSVGESGPTSDQFNAVPLGRTPRMAILDAIRDGVPIWLGSSRQVEASYPEAYRSFKRGGEVSVASLPLFAQGRCIGGLAFVFAGARRFPEDERAFLQVMSWHSAQALERGRLYAAEKQARANAQANERRSALLSSIGTLLTTSLDHASTMGAITRATVPAIADWCLVELEDERLAGRPVMAAHVDPEKVPLVVELSRRYRALGHSEHGIPAVIRTGKSQLYRMIDLPSLRDAFPADPELGELYIRTGMASAMVVPINARQRTIGAILLVSVRLEHLYGDEDLAMAEEIGRRAGTTIDNARLYREAREADRLKDEFLAMLGHELRNPLSPILTALDLMNLRGTDAFAHERTIIARQVQHVVQLVDDLLDVSRIIRGKIHLQKAPVDLAQVIAKAVEMASPILERRSQRLSVQAPAGLTLFADEGRLAQAIANLLTNAAKYTEPDGAIAIIVETEPGHVRICVSDSGIGIAPELLPKIFDLFVQAQGSLDRAGGGLGLGLTIVRNMVELHGGSVAAHSDGLGRGSEFVIRLPLDEERPTEPVTFGPLPTLQTPFAPRRVLVVDDNADAAHLLATALEVLGCATQIAHDGPSAIAAAESFEPELALLDIGLPVMDGYELARRFRAMKSTVRTRLVAITGYGQDTDRDRSRDAGFDEHLVKPVALETIRALVAALADR
jgi:signal transduction histidine kinase/PAS domain-containing protein